MPLVTPRLDLILQTPDAVLRWVATLPADVRAQVSPDWLERVRNTSPGDMWALTHNAIERMSGEHVGTVAFKGPPDAKGIVEIAYGIEPEHQGRGFATEAATALVAFALADDRVRTVRAHSKADNAASARVLVKCGFRSLGEVVDPEDGPVLRWELVR
ncbi:MAG: GNAT family N-acetyltransferase [Pirellulales bacterium]